MHESKRRRQRIRRPTPLIRAYRHMEGCWGRGEEAERYTEKSRRSENTAGPSTTLIAMKLREAPLRMTISISIHRSVPSYIHPAPKLFCFCECAALNSFSIRQPLNSKGAHYKRWFCD